MLAVLYTRTCSRSTTEARARCVQHTIKSMDHYRSKVQRETYLCIPFDQNGRTQNDLDVIVEDQHLVQVKDEVRVIIVDVCADDDRGEVRKCSRTGDHLWRVESISPLRRRREYACKSIQVNAALGAR